MIRCLSLIPLSAKGVTFQIEDADAPFDSRRQQPWEMWLPFGSWPTEVSADRAQLSDEDLVLLGRSDRWTSIDLSDSKVTALGLQSIGRQARLRNLCFSHAAIPNDALSSLEQFPTLEGLWLDSTPISNDGLEQVGKCRSIRGIFLDRTIISGEGLRHLRQLPQLQALSLGWCPRLKDSDAELLASNPRLLVLNVSFTPISDAGMEFLSHSKSLDCLRANGCSISPAGMRSLSRCANLKDLELDSSTLDEDGLAVIAEAFDPLEGRESDSTSGPTLRPFPSLSWLSIRWTSVSEEAVRRARERRPDIAIRYLPDH
jgi:hypothetical protein